MKLKIMSFVLILWAQALSTEQPSGTTNIFHFHFGFNTSAQGGSASNISDLAAETKIQLDTKLHTDQKSDQKSDQGNKQATNHENKNDLHQNVITSPSEKTASVFGKYGLKHALYFTAGTIACAYALRTVIIHQTTRVLKKKRSWCNWKHEFSFQELTQERPEKLAQELLTTIQERHVNPHNPADHVYPVTQFLDTIHHETTILNRYLQLVKWEQKLQLYRIYAHKDLTSVVTQRLDKLAYLKSLFFDWAREHRTKRTLRATA